MSLTFGLHQVIPQMDVSYKKGSFMSEPNFRHLGTSDYLNEKKSGFGKKFFAQTLQLGNNRDFALDGFATKDVAVFLWRSRALVVKWSTKNGVQKTFWCSVIFVTCVFDQLGSQIISTPLRL